MDFPITCVFLMYICTTFDSWVFFMHGQVPCVLTKPEGCLNESAKYQRKYAARQGMMAYIKNINTMLYDIISHIRSLFL